MDYAKMRRIADELSEFAEHLEGRWKVEIGPNGPVLAMMSPTNRHALNARHIRQQLDAQLPTTHPGWICENTPDLENPATGRMRQPDLVVCLEEALDSDRDALAPHEVLLTIEIVSPSNPDNDYTEKMADYPAMGIPTYLIVDPRKGTIEVHSMPTPAGYQNHASYIFGDHVTVGEWIIDTSRFRRYGAIGTTQDGSR
ncbi:Uma2 family endonuclease [Streptomyces sp. ET3-23]|uniref:Uma2 family endonuclease n=1 Tax=Streptomyces sp. ET3-23 TaxID=2885643 RepID=UPI001D11AC66|nr:Uma2 family endonuclease [Streptomyces sp. ET3-23]MCC2280716.1 Uma2 family endonuclease [Streptomyces sp. ET3-23]